MENLIKYQKIGVKIKKSYDKKYSKKYRKSDELGIGNETHKHICEILNNICLSFKHKILVLDVGCGTGRYFYCLKNVKRLIGIDISPYMLKEAITPVNKKKIQVKYINLICGNVFEMSFPNCFFDFIYSIGVLGEHSPFDLYICNKLFNWLKPKGKLFFTVVDSSSIPKTFKRKTAETIYPILLPIFKEHLIWKLKRFYLTKKELEEIMRKSKFNDYKIFRYVSTSLNWKGAHYECIATK